MKNVQDSIPIHSNDKLTRFDDGSYQYSDSYGESWDFDTAEDFEQWAEDEGMAFDYDVQEFFEEDKAIEIIRRNISYPDAYSEMMDAGIKFPDLFWNRHIDQCGQKTANNQPAARLTTGA